MVDAGLLAAGLLAGSLAAGRLAAGLLLAADSAAAPLGHRQSAPSQTQTRCWRISLRPPVGVRAACLVVPCMLE